MAASGAQGAGLGGDDELDDHHGAHEEGGPPIGLGNQQEGAPAAAGGAPDPVAGLGQTNVRALAAREIVPGAEVWDVAQWPKLRANRIADATTADVTATGDPAPPVPPGGPQGASCGLGDQVRVVLGCHTLLSTMISPLHTPAPDSDVCPTTVHSP